VLVLEFDESSYGDSVICRPLDDFVVAFADVVVVVVAVADVVVVFDAVVAVVDDFVVAVADVVVVDAVVAVVDDFAVAVAGVVFVFVVSDDDVAVLLAAFLSVSFCLWYARYCAG